MLYIVILVLECTLYINIMIRFILINNHKHLIKWTLLQISVFASKEYSIILPNILI